MKKQILLFAAITIFSCSNNSDSLDNSNEENTTDDFTEFILPECVDFVEFSINSSLLLHLRALGYDTNNDGKISCEEAANVIELDLFDDKRIPNLKGIESLVNLKKIEGTLNMNGRTANFYNNINLEEILFNTVLNSSNNISSHVSTVVLPNSNSLKKINFSRTVVSELLNTSNQNSLESIIMSSQTGLRGYLDLENCINLTDVNLYGCHIEKIILGNHPNLNELNLYSNKLRTIDLTGLPALEKINLNFNSIDNLNIMNNLSLKNLEARGNWIPNIDLSNNESLEKIDLSENRLVNLDLNTNIQLTNLDLEKNDIASLNLSENINLEGIDLRENKLNFLQVNNGNNENIFGINTTNNPDLYCIKIDLNFNPDNNWVKDDIAIYSSNCN